MALLLLLLLSLCSGGLSQSQSVAGDPARAIERLPLLKSEHEKDRSLRLGFETALAGDLDAAKRYLPLVVDRPWLEELDFRSACALARAIAAEHADDGSPRPAAALAERFVLAAGLHNPAFALRETDQYLPLAGGTRLFEQFARAAPDQAMGLASGTSKGSREHRALLSGAAAPELQLLARLAENDSIDLPRRGRLAILAGRIVRGELSFESALRVAGSTVQFFSMVLEMRAKAGPGEMAALDRALENESLVLCQAAQQGPDRTLTSDLSHFGADELYTVLALGRAEATPRVFAAVFDRLLLPKWKASLPKGASLIGWLDRTKNWELRDFAAGALAASRFDPLVLIAGPEIVSRLVRDVDRSADPLKEAMRVAEIVDATASPVLLKQMASIVSEEFVRCRDAGDLRGTTLYGLLAAKLSGNVAATPYLPFFNASQTLDAGVLFGKDNDCVERYFFYDDEDGVESFESFRNSYQGDPAWEIQDRGDYIHLVGRNPDGRRIEIFANVPINGHLPKNRSREGEAGRRQQIITEVLDERGLIPTVIVHRGHSFWVQRTLTYLATTTRLVILGSCGGATEIHSVIEASHDAQVIATRGIGATEINDTIMKAVNDRILAGDRIIHWNGFWQELKTHLGNSALFREYLLPNQDPGTILLRAYRQYLDSLN